MIELAHELISLVEKYEKEEEYDFHDHGPDQMEIGRIMRTCIREAGYINRDSDVLYFLTMALVDRDVSPWTYHSIARFCRDFQNFYSGERYNLDAAIIRYEESPMREFAHELISRVEVYEKEVDLREEEYDFHEFNPDQVEIGRIMRTFIRESGYINRDSDVLYALTMALVYRDPTVWTYESIVHFCYHFENYYSGERYNLDAAIDQVMEMKMKIQLCAKRFLARKILAELKLRKLTLVQLRVKSSISMLTMDLLRKIVKIRLH